MVATITKRDLTGQVFGKLTALYVGHTRKGRRGWMCECTCGGTKVIETHNLTHGYTKSCGCAILTMRDITGETFGDLTVVEFVRKNCQDKSIWLVRCSCGEEFELTGSKLWNGKIKTCPKTQNHLHPYERGEYPRYIRRCYDISIHDYNSMYAAQQGKCKICNIKDDLVIDHCHSNGHVRALLCQGCNKGIGCFGEDVERMLYAVEFLKNLEIVNVGKCIEY